MESLNHGTWTAEESTALIEGLKRTGYTKSSLGLRGLVPHRSWVSIKIQARYLDHKLNNGNHRNKGKLKNRRELTSLSKAEVKKLVNQVKYKKRFFWTKPEISRLRKLMQEHGMHAIRFAN